MADYTIKARPTIYNGIRMRSRLEARFAADLDRCKQHETWAYEGDAYADITGDYLPDFTIVSPTGETVIVDVKPTERMARDLITSKKMRPVWSTNPEAHLVAVYPTDPKANDTHRRSWQWCVDYGVTTWESILRHCGVDATRTDDDTSFESVYEFPHEGFDDVRIKLCWNDEFDKVWDNANSYKGKVDNEHVIWERQSHRSNGWALVGEMFPRSAWAPRLIEVAPSGRVTDCYVGQTFLFESLGWFLEKLAWA